MAHGSSGSLTMAVQPTKTAVEANEAGNGVSTNINPVSTMLQPLSPTEAAFEDVLRAALQEAPTGANSLADAASALDDLCSQWPHNTAFSPTSELQLTYDPMVGDGWDAHDPLTTIGDVDWEGMLELPPY